MDVVAQRRGLVQQMRRVALRHEVEAVRDNANRFAVETMMQKVLALPGLAAQDRDVVRSFLPAAPEQPQRREWQIVSLRQPFLWGRDAHALEP